MLIIVKMDSFLELGSTNNNNNKNNLCPLSLCDKAAHAFFKTSYTTYFCVQVTKERKSFGTGVSKCRSFYFGPDLNFNLSLFSF